MAEAEVGAGETAMLALDAELQVALLPKDPNDDKNLFLETRAGTGGDESALFAGDLFRMYSRYAERQRWKVEVISKNESDLGGFREIIARIEGNGAYSKLKFESGGHRVQRVPATEAQGRIHTSACTIAVMPEADELGTIAINPADQWAYMEKTGQWRFTPPTHVVAALDEAISQFVEEGGQPARLARYQANGRALVDGMAALGFKVFLRPQVQAPIIYTFHAPGHAAYDFKRFYAGAKARGFMLYPGKLTQVETFRVGCIGAIGPNEMRQAVLAVSETLGEMGIASGAPAL